MDSNGNGSVMGSELQVSTDAWVVWDLYKLYDKADNESDSPAT